MPREEASALSSASYSAAASAPSPSLRCMFATERSSEAVAQPLRRLEPRRRAREVALLAGGDAARVLLVRERGVGLAHLLAAAQPLEQLGRHASRLRHLRPEQLRLRHHPVVAVVLPRAVASAVVVCRQLGCHLRRRLGACEGGGLASGDVNTSPLAAATAASTSRPPPPPLLCRHLLLFRGGAAGVAAGVALAAARRARADPPGRASPRRRRWAAAPRSPRPRRRGRRASISPSRSSSAAELAGGGTATRQASARRAARPAATPSTGAARGSDPAAARARRAAPSPRICRASDGRSTAASSTTIAAATSATSTTAATTLLRHICERLGHARPSACVARAQQRLSGEEPAYLRLSRCRLDLAPRFLNDILRRVAHRLAQTMECPSPGACVRIDGGYCPERCAIDECVRDITEYVAGSAAISQKWDRRRCDAPDASAAAAGVEAAFMPSLRAGEEGPHLHQPSAKGRSQKRI